MDRILHWYKVHNPYFDLRMAVYFVGNQMMFLMEFQILWRVSVHYLLVSTYSVTHARSLKAELVSWTFEDILGIHSEG